MKFLLTCVLVFMLLCTMFDSALVQFKKRFSSAEDIRTEPVSYIDNTFNYKELIIVKDLRCLSFCEHNLAPTLYSIHLAYLPDRHLLGIGYIQRVIEFFANKPNIQEHLVVEIAEFIHSKSAAKTTMALLQGSHFCSQLDNRRQQESSMITMHSCGKANARIKNSFIRLIML